MVEYVNGNLFDSKADCLVNTVNCEGYMGKGVAYQFKCRFPENNKSYVKACKSGALQIGKIHYFVEDGITIINFPTKDKWREKSKLSYIEMGLDAFVKVLPELQVKKIAIPPLGCGNGGLDWLEVKAILEQKLENIEKDYHFLIFEPGKNYIQKAVAAPKMSVSSLIILKLSMGMKKHTKLWLQNTAYFINVYAKEEYFKFKTHMYGPYAHSIDIISRSIGEYQSYYGLEGTENTYNHIYQNVCSDKTMKTLKHLENAIERAIETVNEINDTHDLEGISTVLYLIQVETGISEKQIITNFKNWSEDKAKRFSESDIRKYVFYLAQKGIINILGGYQI